MSTATPRPATYPPSVASARSLAPGRRRLTLGVVAALVALSAPFSGCRYGYHGGGWPREDGTIEGRSPADQRRGGVGDGGGAGRARGGTEQIVEEALALAAGGREDEALAILTRAIERNPMLGVAHIAMADIYTSRGDYTDAERSYATAAKVEPNNFTAQFKHGLTLHLLNRVADAIRAYLRALALQPDDFEANLNIATAYLQLDGPRQAVPYALRAVALNPASGPAHANLGAVYSALDRHLEAIREYESASELMELKPELLLNLAESLGKAARYQQMVNTLDELLRLKPSAAAYERLGFAHFKLRRYERAIESFRGGIALDRAYYPALNGLGVCLLNQFLVSARRDEAALTEALAALRASLRINQNQPRIVELLSRYGR